jgi:hypothetical protein
MKNILLSLFVATALFACKDDDTTEPQVATIIENEPTTSCGETQICFTLNDTAYTNQVFMYKLDDTTYFAKYEKDGKQLSIDWISETPTTGTFPAGLNKKKGQSRIYWFPKTNQIWMSDSGEVVITKHENKTVSATFSGRLNKLSGTQPTGETILVKNGVFTNGKYS